MKKNFSELEYKKEDSKIRKIEIEDINRIFEIEKASFPSPWTKETLKMQICSPIALNYLLEVHERIVGYIMCLLAYDECHVLSLAVDPKFRKKGYATKLLSYTLSTLKQRGVKYVFLEVRENNFVAIHLYLKFGFEIIGRRKGYYQDTKEDALLMRLRL